jgi:uncharacterized protein (TIGR02001 family)
MKKISFVVAGLLAVSATQLFAQTAAPAAEAAPAATAASAPTPDWTITGNMALSSEYRFRGLAQTNKNPEFSGGFDVTHVSGFYFGNWNSNIDSTQYQGANIEMDFYAGYRGTWGDLGYDIGGYYYYYPGSGTGSGKSLGSIDNKEVYVGVSYGPVSAKVYIPVDDFFSAHKNAAALGNPNTSSASGSFYVTVDAAQDVGNGFGLIGHFGYQDLKGSAKLAEDGSNPTHFYSNYWDWKLGGQYSFANGYVVSLVYVDTSITTRAYVGGKVISGATGVLSVSKTF